MTYYPMNNGNPPIHFNNNDSEWTFQNQSTIMNYSGLPSPAHIPLEGGISQQTVSIMAVNTTNPTNAPIIPLLDPSKQYHPEWGVIKNKDFHPLTLKHQRDFENLFHEGTAIQDFHFWQANLGGYCLADMVQATVVSPEGTFILQRRVVEGAPHPGRRKKKSGLD